MKSQRGDVAREIGAVFAGLDGLMEALGWEPESGLQVVDGRILAQRHYPDVDPARPALVRCLGGREQLARIARCLAVQYAPEQPIRMLRPNLLDSVLELTLGEIAGSGSDARDNADAFGALPETLRDWVLAIPARPGSGSMLELAEVIAHLRAPDGCPWDREQTHRSLRPYLIEEAYEAVEAIDRGEVAVLAEELGDVLLQVVLHAQVAAEAGDFRLVEVIRSIRDKLLRRHPHVFGDAEADTAEQVLTNWEQLKRAEREEKGAPESPFAGIPAAMPALARAEAALKKAKRISSLHDLVEGYASDAPELAPDPDPLARATRDEVQLGRLLMTLSAAAMARGLDAEGALREQVTRFIAEAEARLERAEDHPG